MSRLRAERERQHMSLRELAHFAGCSHNTVARAERGEGDIAPAIKVGIARVLRVPVADLFEAEAHVDPPGGPDAGAA